MTDEKQEKKPRRISEFVEGERIFDSTGFSLVKLTLNGIEEPVELAIKSTGVAEFQEELTGKAPRPPVKKEVIKKDSIEGKLLGLDEDRLMQVFDNTDEDYIDALEKHNQDFVWRIVVFALVGSWKKKDGTEATTFEEKKAILKSTGITSSHTDQIFKEHERTMSWGLVVTVVAYALLHILTTNSIINALSITIIFLFFGLIYKTTENSIGPMIAWTLVNRQALLVASMLFI